VYDGISPFIPNAIKVNGNNMKFPLVGRGDENPLKKVCRQQHAQPVLAAVVVNSAGKLA
jgi:hypothetical protein